MQRRFYKQYLWRCKKYRYPFQYYFCLYFFNFLIVIKLVSTYIVGFPLTNFLDHRPSSRLKYSDVYSDSDEENLDPLIKLNNYLLVKFSSKKTTKYYVGVVTSLNGGNILVKFLRRQEGDPGYYVFPRADDTSEIGKEDIEIMLPTPRIDNRNHYFFSIDFNKYQNNLY